MCTLELFPTHATTIVICIRSISCFLFDAPVRSLCPGLANVPQRFGEDAASRQLDVKLGQLAFLGHSMLACGVPPSEVSSVCLERSRVLFLSRFFLVSRAFMSPNLYSLVTYDGRSSGNISSDFHIAVVSAPASVPSLPPAAVHCSSATVLPYMRPYNIRWLG